MNCVGGQRLWTRELTLAGALDYSANVGSLTTQSQLERVTAHVTDAVAKGATVLAGGNPRPDIGPLFFEPTVLMGVTPEMDCDANETFGPVVSVAIVDSKEEAILTANNSEFGLRFASLSITPHG
jgi:acyl-CoA reductase-like NAD-dependent aldehyde dehydrogenase